MNICTVSEITGEMPKKRLIRYGGDIREHPRYSVEEVALYLRVPASTLKAWLRGQNYKTKYGERVIFKPVIEPADPDNKLLSFYNLAEAHVLRSTRERNVPLKNVRKALAFLREKIPSKHPLLGHDFTEFGGDIFIEHLGLPMNATRYGQFAMKGILEKYLRRIDRDVDMMPIQIYPMYSKRLAINPQLSSGKPVVKGTGIMASILRDRNKSGESIAELAKDYGLKPIEIKEAIEEVTAA